MPDTPILVAGVPLVFDESAPFSSFTYDYFVEFLLPVATLCFTLLSIMVELQQVINLCLDFDEDELQQQSADTHADKKEKPGSTKAQQNNSNNGQPAEVADQTELNLGWSDNTDDTFFESIVGLLWTFFWDNLKYICSLERILFIIFFGKLFRLREKGKVGVWLLCVTIPFYIQATLLYFYLGKSLEYG